MPPTIPLCARDSVVEEVEEWLTKHLRRIGQITGAQVLAARVRDPGVCRGDDLLRADIVEQGHSEWELFR